MSHTKPAGSSGCDCDKQATIPFLDTALEIKDEKIISDFYRKPSDRNQTFVAVLRPPETRDHLHALLSRPPHYA